MGTAFRVITPPTTEPLTLVEAKRYCRVDFADPVNDAKISGLISSARQFAEGVMCRALATQTIRAEYIIDAPQSGRISGAIDDREPNWYHYNQELGANPFGIAMFYYDLPRPPLQGVTSVKYQYTVFDTDPNSGVPGYWTAFTGVYVTDIDREPGRVWFQDPPTTFRWQFVYVAGYDGVSFVMPPDMKQALGELVAFWYDNSEGAELPDGLMKKLLLNKNWATP
jgi:hypothetical protein